jgi:hypothetical protein
MREGGHTRRHAGAPRSLRGQGSPPPAVRVARPFSHGRRVPPGRALAASPCTSPVRVPSESLRRRRVALHLPRSPPSSSPPGTVSRPWKPSSHGCVRAPLCARTSLGHLLAALEAVHRRHLHPVQPRRLPHHTHARPLFRRRQMEIDSACVGRLLFRVRRPRALPRSPTSRPCVRTAHWRAAMLPACRPYAGMPGTPLVLVSGPVHPGPCLRCFRAVQSPGGLPRPETAANGDQHS